MLRKTPLKRKTPMKRVGFKKKQWNPNAPNTTKPRKQMAQRSSKRAKQERVYSSSHSSFLAAHPVCPVTGEKTTQIHHSAKREGQWLTCRRYWIAVSLEGHLWIESHKKEAEKYGLMVRISETFNDHSDTLLKAGITDLSVPVFYLIYSNLPLVNENNQPIYGS
jgi:hypothetical protein